MVFNKKFVEIGRVAYIVSGPFSGRLCAIIDIIDQNKALVVGPVTGVPLLAINFKSLHLTRFVLNFRHSAKSHEVKTAWERKAINRRWAQSQWAKKIECRKKKAKMTDFDRYKLMRAKQSRNKIIRLEVGKLRKKPLRDVLPKTSPPKPKAVYKPRPKSKKLVITKGKDTKGKAASTTEVKSKKSVAAK
ncbi:RP-L14e [Acanthosepion pharaonis]|uniref:Large ribosomal subunit protein eL14 n=1 Tax=Acanthosepion pharaonis TaxID=158019 RepID=A0A812C4Z4_ACAPH|nr:RP-L14e [Sepia pharaonis]